MTRLLRLIPILGALALAVGVAAPAGAAETGSDYRVVTLHKPGTPWKTATIAVDVVFRYNEHPPAQNEDVDIQAATRVTKGPGAYRVQIEKLNLGTPADRAGGPLETSGPVNSGPFPLVRDWTPWSTPNPPFHGSLYCRYDAAVKVSVRWDDGTLTKNYVVRTGMATHALSDTAECVEG